MRAGAGPPFGAAGGRSNDIQTDRAQAKAWAGVRRHASRSMGDGSGWSKGAVGDLNDAKASLSFLWCAKAPTKTEVLSLFFILGNEAHSGPVLGGRQPL